MKNLKTLIALFIMLVSTISFAADNNSVPMLRGYDAVSYHTIGRPVMGNGKHVATYKGQTYLFITQENKNTFNKNPEKYAPMYGGWCAYGVGAGKKFHGDPLVWEIVDGKLYLNLNNQIKGVWMQDVAGNIKDADKMWEKIKDTPASEL